MTHYTQKWRCPICLRKVEDISAPRNPYPCYRCIKNDAAVSQANEAVIAAKRQLDDAMHDLVMYAQACNESNKGMEERGFKWVEDPSNKRTELAWGEWIKETETGWERPAKSLYIRIDNLEYNLAVGTFWTGVQIRNAPTPPISEDYDIYLEQHLREVDDRLITDNAMIKPENGLQFYSVPKIINAGACGYTTVVPDQP